jgi:hypothetical protein
MSDAKSERLGLRGTLTLFDSTLRLVAEKYVSSIWGPLCDWPLVARVQQSGTTPNLWRAERKEIRRNLRSMSHSGYVDARQVPITNFAHKAGIVGDHGMRAVLAARDMSAEGKAPALYLVGLPPSLSWGRLHGPIWKT